MKTRSILGAAAAAATLLTASQALAANNDPPPAGPVIMDFHGQAINHSYQQFTTDFKATSALTNLSFAMREDPAFIVLDDISLTNLTHPGGELVTNGGFESGIVGDNAPVGWTYLNIFGASFAGVVENNTDESGCAHTGTNCYFDGAVQAYDAITQAIVTNPGDTYHLTFWMFDNGGLSTFSHLSTNGNTTGTGGNGADLIVFGGDLPTPGGGVPEPATWAMMIAGFGGLGAMLRRRRLWAVA